MEPSAPPSVSDMATGLKVCSKVSVAWEVDLPDLLHTEGYTVQTAALLTLSSGLRRGTLVRPCMLLRTRGFTKRGDSRMSFWGTECPSAVPVLGTPRGNE